MIHDDILFSKEEDARKGIEECSKSLIGRILADRSFNFGTMEAALGGIWGHPHGFRVMDHGDSIFQFFFSKEVDALRVEGGAPWLFKHYILNLKRWRNDLKIEEEELIHVPIWIQLWGMPKHFKTMELGRKIGDRIGEVKDVGIFLVKGKESRIVKVKINMDVTKVLRHQVKIASPNKKVLDIMLKYEGIGCFYYYCGHIGHEVRSCSEFLENATKDVAQGRNYRIMAESRSNRQKGQRK